MLKVLLSADLIDTPIFLALDTSRLPPVSSDTQDMSALLSSIEEVKSDLALLTGCQKELAESQATLSSLVHSNNSVSPEEKQQKIPPLPSTQLPSTTAEPTYSEALQSDTMLAVGRDDGCNYIETTELDADAYEEPAAIKQPPVFERTFTNSRHHSHKPASVGAHRKPGENLQGPAKPRAHRTSAQGGIVFGKGTAPGLQAAQHPQHCSSNNRVCSGVFVTNLMPRTTATQMERYIKQETGHAVPVEKLQTRYNTYSSFYIRCEQPLRKELLSPFLWPDDTKVKLYFS